MYEDIYIYIHIYIYVNVVLHVYKYKYNNAKTHTHICTCVVCVYRHVYMCSVCVYTDIRIYIYMCTHTFAPTKGRFTFGASVRCTRLPGENKSAAFKELKGTQ